jgi:hypothetical protein
MMLRYCADDEVNMRIATRCGDLCQVYAAEGVKQKKALVKAFFVYQEEPGFYFIVDGTSIYHSA